VYHICNSRHPLLSLHRRLALRSREFQFRVKSISGSYFTPEEVKLLQVLLLSTPPSTLNPRP